MHKGLLRFALVVLFSLQASGLKSQSLDELASEVLAGRTCNESSDRITCTYTVGNDLNFEIVDLGTSYAFINVWKSNGLDGDFFIGTSPLTSIPELRQGMHECLKIKPGTESEYMMIVHEVYVSHFTGSVYTDLITCQQDGNDS